MALAVLFVVAVFVIAVAVLEALLVLLLLVLVVFVIAVAVLLFAVQSESREARWACRDERLRGLVVEGCKCVSEGRECMI